VADPVEIPPVRTNIESHIYLLLASIVIVVATHYPLLDMPYFWDELGQFIPASLDLLRDGALVPHSTVPNVHPPGVMAFLAAVWKVAGTSVIVTRVAMLHLAALGVYATFLLAIRMCRGVPGAPAFPIALLLLVTPLFHAQALLAQLDMPAMTFTIVSLVLFLHRRFAWCAVACTVLVLMKETGLVAPALFAAWLVLREKRWREAAYFAAPFVVLAAWLVLLKQSTGHWLGDSGFAHYNVTYSLSPVRIVFSLLRRAFYLFVADFRWIGAIGIIYGLRKTRLFFTEEWMLVGLFFAGHVTLVSVLGGATLERYLLPVFPLLYVAVATGWSTMTRVWRAASFAALMLGMFTGFYFNPPYPFPFENNLAMVDFVELQKSTAEYLERDHPNATIATAWPYTGALRSPDLSFVRKPLKVVDTGDFHVKNVVDAVTKSNADVLVIYSRTWEPPASVFSIPLVERFLRRYYEYEPQISTSEVESKLGMKSRFRFSQRGQWIQVFTR